MKILLINSLDLGGGASAIARSLGETLLSRGHEVAMVVGLKRTQLPWVHEVRVPAQGTPVESLVRRTLGWLTRQSTSHPKVHERTRRLLQLTQVRSAWNQARGFEDFALRSSGRILEQLNFDPEVIHVHNLHVFAGMTHFDIRALPALSAERRLVFTLHDTWAFTGHCAYFFACERWRTGCGQCPDLSMYPAIRYDRSAESLSTKAGVYRNLRYTLTGPSRWIVDCARASVLAGGMERSQVVPNGIDLTFFSPAPSFHEARRALGLADDERAIAFISDLGRNTPYRDYGFMERVLAEYEASARTGRLVVFEVGGQAGERRGARTRQVGTGVLNVTGVRDLLRGCDALLHPAKTDNFPTVILEAMACGTPAIATAVGGIPEQIVPGVDGFLHAPGDLGAALSALDTIAADVRGTGRLRAAARQSAEARFDRTRMVTDYEALYGAK